MAIIIKTMGKAIPKKVMSNSDFPASLDTSDEWIRSHTGIGSRYIASEEDTSASLGSEACKEALLNQHKEKYKNLFSAGSQTAEISDIDLIICATATAEYQGFPSNACLIQKELDAKKAVCFDLSAACSGFLYAIDTAAALMERHGWHYALVCGSEVLSKIVDWNDRSTCVLFGDGAGAVLLENTFEKTKEGIGSVILGSDGTGYDALYMGDYLKMNGRTVYNFAVGVITETVKSLLQKENMNMEDVDLVVCHQANARILEAAAKRLGADMNKFVCNMENYGNTSAASIPITLDDLVLDGRLKKGMTIITAGFGAGLTWGGAVIRF
ncbi:ketoacyl-ACP synthase III [Treponema sp. OMZ 788]|uniref:beta-ketoacyl-ACP synthase III n=1 Tax=Treponema sp. OMZ 788 TaxID=2563664 RepID=UPI0020A3CB4E|nr:beta-ketoacyl-ACP synthase III [Treponema sp. OMZ 788]UTC64295.1 ketoacyl-ACP synthase III [Treponema sp. OMZ 788]